MCYNFPHYVCASSDEVQTKDDSIWTGNRVTRTQNALHTFASCDHVWRMLNMWLVARPEAVPALLMYDSALVYTNSYRCFEVPCYPRLQHSSKWGKRDRILAVVTRASQMKTLNIFLFFITDDMVCWSMTHTQMSGYSIHCCKGLSCHYSVCLTRSRRVCYRTNAVHALPSPLVHLL